MQTLKASSIGGIDVFAAVRTDAATIAAPVPGPSIEGLKDALGRSLLKVGGSRTAPLLFLAPSVEVDAIEAEPTLLQDRNVLVAFRNGERVEAVADWLAYHKSEQGAEAALIFDRARPGTDDFAGQMQTMKLATDVVLVNSEIPMGAAQGADLRAVPPAAPKSDDAPSNPWHATLQHQAIYEILRYGFLTQSRAVSFVDVSDIILPSSNQKTVFEQCSEQETGYLSLRGIETYPWRLRQGKPAPHSDHISKRRSERRVLLSWAAALKNMPDNAVWQAGHPLNAVPDKANPATFARAMGVVFPGWPVNRLVKKSELAEQTALVTLMERAFGASPIRLPAPTAIPPAPPNGQVTIVSAMKNEGPFILDWIAHNRAMGVANHLIYSNDCEDGTDHLLSLLAEAGVTHRDNPYRATDRVPQYAAFRAAEDEAVVNHADWLMTLDVDEYLNIHAGDGTLTALFETLPQAHVISVPWRMFGNADQHRFLDEPVTEQFTQCAPEYAPRPLQAWAFKTLYRNAGLFRRLGVHRPKGLVRAYQDSLSWVDANGQPLPHAIWSRAWRMSKGQWGYTHATLNHYAVRSAESFLIKRERGKVNRTKREQGLAYWFRMNHNAEEDTSIQRFSKRVASEKAALMALPGVAEAHAKAVLWHKTRAAALRTAPDFLPLYNEITSERMQHLSRMATYFGANVHLVGPQVIPDDIAARDPSEPFFWSVNLR